MPSMQGVVTIARESGFQLVDDVGAFGLGVLPLLGLCAARPDVSVRFAQPENRPEAPEHGPPPRTGHVASKPWAPSLRRSA